MGAMIRVATTPLRVFTARAAPQPQDQIMKQLLMFGIAASVLFVATGAQAATSAITIQSAYGSEVICDVKHFSSTIKTLSAPAGATRTGEFALPNKPTERLSLYCRARRTSGSWQNVSWVSRYRISELNNKKITVTCRAGASLSCTPGTAAFSGGGSGNSGNSASGNNNSAPATSGQGGATTQSSVKLTNQLGTTMVCTITQAGRTVLSIAATGGNSTTKAFSVAANALLSISCVSGGKRIGWSNKFRAADLARDFIDIRCLGGAQLCSSTRGSQAPAAPTPSTSSSPTPTPVDTDGSDKSLTFTMKSDYKDPVTCTLKDGATTLATLAVPARERTGKTTRFAVPNTDYLDMVCTASDGKKSPKYRVSASGLRRGTATKLNGSCYSGGTPVCNANAR